MASPSLALAATATEGQENENPIYVLSDLGLEALSLRGRINTLQKIKFVSPVT